MILVLLWVCFASLVTVHVVLARTVGQRRGPLWGWLSLLLFPLLPYLGLKVSARTASALWLGLLVGYLALLFAATH